MPVPSSFDDLDTNANNNSPPGTESAKGNVDNYLRQAFAFIKQNRNFITALLGTDSSNKASARATLGADSMPRVQGLTGNVNSATPLTKYDLSANAVTLRNSTGGTITRYNTGTLTCDLGLAGPIANGRDQSAAFTASSWVYLYFIWNGTTLATLASTTAPTSFTGSTLPTGYTHWAFATALRWNASSNIIPCYTRGSTVYYDVVTGGVIRVLASGVATTMTAVDFSALVPPIHLLTTFLASLSTNHNAAGGTFEAYFRPTGASNEGSIDLSAYSQVAGVTNTNRGQFTMPLGTAQKLDYKLSQAPSTAGGLSLDVKSFRIPNGDA